MNSGRLLTLLLVFGMVESLRRYLVNATFTAIWVVFALVSAASFGASWVFTCLIEVRLIDPDPAFFRYLTTLASCSSAGLTKFRHSRSRWTTPG